MTRKQMTQAASTEAALGTHRTIVVRSFVPTGFGTVGPPACGDRVGAAEPYRSMFPPPPPRTFWASSSQGTDVSETVTGEREVSIPAFSDPANFQIDVALNQLDGSYATPLGLLGSQWDTGTDTSPWKDSSGAPITLPGSLLIGGSGKNIHRCIPRKSKGHPIHSGFAARPHVGRRGITVDLRYRISHFSNAAVHHLANWSGHDSGSRQQQPGAMPSIRGHPEGGLNRADIHLSDRVRLFKRVGPLLTDLPPVAVPRISREPPPHVPPLCELSRLKETFDRTHFSGVFDATLEIEK